MANLQRIAEEEKESKFGYVYAVSGPGRVFIYYFLHFQVSYKVCATEYLYFDLGLLFPLFL